MSVVAKADMMVDWSAAGWVVKWVDLRHTFEKTGQGWVVSK